MKPQAHYLNKYKILKILIYYYTYKYSVAAVKVKERIDPKFIIFIALFINISPINDIFIILILSFIENSVIFVL